MHIQKYRTVFGISRVNKNIYYKQNTKIFGY